MRAPERREPRKIVVDRCARAHQHDTVEVVAVARRRSVAGLQPGLQDLHLAGPVAGDLADPLVLGERDARVDHEELHEPGL